MHCPDDIADLKDVLAYKLITSTLEHPFHERADYNNEDLDELASLNVLVVLSFTRT